MKLSLDWLQDYIELSESPEEIARLITMHIAEVDEIHYQAALVKNVVVAQVLQIHVHPNADTLHVGTFNVGEAKPRQIVFGGKAILKVGDRLPVALPGTLVKGITIEQRKLRGEVSQGMCCLNSELGILDNKDHVHFFDKSVAPGTPLAEALQLNDVIFEIDNKTLTHRADLFNHIGFARELSAVLQRPLRLLQLKKINAPTSVPASPELAYTLTVENTTACTRYIGAAFSGVQIKPSPDWMQRRLTALGISVINNLVDITNYVMYEYGQPLHAFDYAKVDNHHIIVKDARAGEVLTTLDGKDRTLNNGELVIADETKPVALAGIIGGVNSEITTSTTSIALESAQFNGTSIRQTAQAMAIRTDGSTRHEKKLGHPFSEQGFWRAVELLAEHANAQLASPVIDTQPSEPPKTSITIQGEYIDRLIGVPITPEQVTTWLTALECEVVQVKNHSSEVSYEVTYEVTVPLFRTDLTSAQDIVEEIARLYGYDAIPEAPVLGSLQPPYTQPDFMLGHTIMQWLSDWGAYEMNNYSFYSLVDLQAGQLDAANHIEMQNPMNQNQQFLRQTLLIGLLRNVEKNINTGYKHFTLAEYGHLYFIDREITVVEGVVLGDFYKAKGYVEAILQRGHIVYTFDGKQYLVDGECVAEVSMIAPDIQQAFGIDQLISHFRVSHFRIYLAELSRHFPSSYQQQSISAYPAIDLDISIEIDKHTTWAELKQTIEKTAGELLHKLDVFDVYEGEDIDQTKRSFGIRMWLQAPDRTLEMTEAEALRANIVKVLKNTFDATHRY